MIHDRTSWRIRMRPAVSALITAVLPIAYFGGPAVHAQSIMRSPSVNIQSRVPSISTPSINTPSMTPTVVTPRIDPNIAGRAVDIGSGRTIPSIRSACTAAERDSSPGASGPPDALVLPPPAEAIGRSVFPRCGRRLAGARHAARGRTCGCEWYSAACCKIISSSTRQPS